MNQNKDKINNKKTAKTDIHIIFENIKKLLIKIEETIEDRSLVEEQYNSLKKNLIWLQEKTTSLLHDVEDNGGCVCTSPEIVDTPKS